MPTIFIIAFLAFLALVILIVVLAVTVFGFRPSRDAHVESGSSSSGADYTSLNPEPARTGSRAPSLISVSASSEAGSESRTTPTPA